jgi:CO/xanthine dehydrogenase Mo-binding subunit
MTTTRVVGKSLPRMDAPGKVAGTAVYAADFALPGMLWGKVLRSAEPHARIVRLDPSGALARPGVRAVVSSADTPEVRYGGAVQDETVFARDRVRYVGQPLAAVAATTLEAAEAALAAIEVVLEPLPPVLDLTAALAPGAPLVHAEWERYAAIPILHRDGNVCNRARIVVGDVDRGFEEADRVFEHRFRTAMVHQGYTEPRAAVAAWDSSGQVTVWSNTQLPFEVQNTLAEILMMSPSKIRVVVPGIGGGFGGKLRVGVEHVAALLARRAGRPVKVVTTTGEELTAAYPRQGAVVELKTGVTRDGRIVAKQGRIWFDTGAFAGSGPGVASVATLVLAGPYRIPNLFIEGYAVYTNKTNCGSYRAPSGPQANFAVESQMDVMADALGLDPLDFRLRNIVREGDEGPTGQVLAGVGHRVERPAARPRPRQGARLRLVDHHRWLLRRLREAQPRRHRHAEHRGGGDRHRRPHRRRAGAGRGAGCRPRRHQPGRRRHPGHALRLRRPGKPNRFRRRQRLSGGGG